MNPKLRKAKDACNQAYNEYMEANKAVCEATTPEEKKEAQKKLFEALENFNKAQQNVIKIRLYPEDSNEESEHE